MIINLEISKHSCALGEGSAKYSSSFFIFLQIFCTICYGFCLWILFFCFFQSWTHDISKEKEFLRKLVKAHVITDLTKGIWAYTHHQPPSASPSGQWNSAGEWTDVGRREALGEANLQAGFLHPRRLENRLQEEFCGKMHLCAFWTKDSCSLKPGGLNRLQEDWINSVPVRQNHSPSNAMPALHFRPPRISNRVRATMTHWFMGASVWLPV